MARLICLLIAAALTLAATPLAAQPYPSRPIRLLVPYPPGGATDLIARVIGQALGTRLGQNVVIENRPGSNGNMAAENAARAAPDGHTLLLGSDSMFGINPNLYSHMPVDAFKDFVAISSLIANQIVLTSGPGLKDVSTFAEFIAVARRTKPPLLYASIGNGSQHHLAMEILKQRAGIDLVHVPYRGGGPAANALLSGEIPVMFGGGSTVPLIKAGNLKGLAVTGPKPSAELPDLPRIAEIYPGFEITPWQGLFAPIGTPDAIITRLRVEVDVILKLPEVVDRLAAAGTGEPLILSPAEFAALIRRDYDRYGEVIRAIGLKLD
jgi:tripartite-type tricarboxylate transporter receptor subunit TctC